MHEESIVLQATQRLACFYIRFAETPLSNNATRQPARILEERFSICTPCRLLSDLDTAVAMMTFGMACSIVRSL